MESKPVFGIDLGTTYSCISKVDQDGRPVVINNALNSVVTPSVVYFADVSTTIAGQDAKDNAKDFPESVVTMVKRSMGDATWVRSFYGTDYKPQQISSIILRKVVEDAKQQEGVPVEDVVITCPAYFGNVERDATRQAGILAGLNVRYIVTEPMAAAFAYGIDNDSDETVLVYDLGGGTFDITLLKVPGTVLATDGDHMLGGADWDKKLADFLVQKFEDETGHPPTELLEDAGAKEDLLQRAEKCKIILSAPGATSPYKVRVQSGTDSTMIEVTRDDFDRITEDLLGRTVALTKSVLERAEELNVKVAKILLVGGSTMMPQIEQRLKSEFPSCELVRKDPNQAVAKGAAIIGFKYHVDDEVQRLMSSGATQEQAQEEVAKSSGASLKGVKKLNETVLRNVSAKSFGLEVVNVDDVDVVNNLVKVDDSIPLSITRVFQTHSDQQDGVLIKVMENKARVSDDTDVTLEDCWEIGRAELSFKHSLPKGSPIQVLFSLSEDGILKVRARDLTTNEEIEASFKSDALLSEEELVEAKKRIDALQVT